MVVVIEHVEHNHPSFFFGLGDRLERARPKVPFACPPLGSDSDRTMTKPATAPADKRRHTPRNDGEGPNYRQGRRQPTGHVGTMFSAEP
jgi:hypothetical protein